MCGCTRATPLSLSEGRGWMHSRSASSPNQASAETGLPRSREASQMVLILIYHRDKLPPRTARSALVWGCVSRRTQLRWVRCLSACIGVFRAGVFPVAAATAWVAAGRRTAKTYGSAACLHGRTWVRIFSQLISVSEIDL